MIQFFPLHNRIFLLPLVFRHKLCTAKLVNLEIGELLESFGNCIITRPVVCSSSLIFVITFPMYSGMSTPFLVKYPATFGRSTNNPTRSPTANCTRSAISIFSPLKLKSPFARS